MGLKDYSQEELADFSLVELTNLILEDENKATDYKELYDRIAEIKNYSNDEKQENIVQFYTDLNVDGRFMTAGSNHWGLKSWYTVDQFDEELTIAPVKKKKKRAAAEDDDELDAEDLEEDFTLDEEGFDEDFGDDDEEEDIAEDDYEGDYQDDDTDEETREVVRDDMHMVGEDDEDGEDEEEGDRI